MCWKSVACQRCSKLNEGSREVFEVKGEGVRV